jgi:lipopolysaccharide export system permease protein
MVKLVDYYIGRAAVLGIFVVWCILTVLFLLLSLLDELRSVENDYGTLDALWVLALTTPKLAYSVFPVSALLGALLGVGGLAATNELVAFRTSGISRLRLAVAALAGTLLITIPVMIMGEFVAPAAEQQARAFKLSERVGLAIIGGPSGMWIRDGKDFVNIQRPILMADRGQQSVDFNKVVIYHFSEESDLQSITRAESATHDGVSWNLETVNRVSLNDDGVSARSSDTLRWSTEIRPELLDAAVTRPKLLSVRSLLEYMQYLDENGLDDTAYLGVLWEKLLFPFTVLALVLAGMPFVFGQARSHNTGVQLFFGMTLGGVFMIASRALEKFGEVYALPPILMIVAPIVLLVLTAVILLRRSV